MNRKSNSPAGIAQRMVRWPFARARRLAAWAFASLGESSFVKPWRRRLDALRHAVHAVPELADRQAALEARYWDHVALARRVAMLEEHVEFLLRELEQAQARGEGLEYANHSPARRAAG